MSGARTASRLVRLYPVSWRARYGEELQALIVDMSGERRVPWRIRADVVGAGGRERLRAAGLGGNSPDARVRGGAGLVLWAWAQFIIAGAIVQKTSEHWRQLLPAGGHPSATVAFDGLIAVAVVTAVIVIAGIGVTLPAVAGLLRAGGWPRIRRSVTRAALISVAFVAATVGIVIWAHSLSAAARQGRDTGYGLVAIAWALLGAGTLGAWTAAAIRTAACLTLPSATLRLEARLATAAAGAMTVMALATAVWWVSVATISPGALTGSPGRHASALVPELVIAMALMLAAVGLGGTGVRQARRALPALADDG